MIRYTTLGRMFTRWGATARVFQGGNTQPRPRPCPKCGGIRKHRMTRRSPCTDSPIIERM